MKAATKSLMAELRTYVDEWDSLSSRIHKLAPRVYALAYQICEDWIADGEVALLSDAWERMGRSFHRTTGCASYWYYCGKLMAEYGINPSAADANSVRLVAGNRRRLPKSALFQAVQLIRDGAPFPEVRKLVRKREAYAELKGERLVSQLKKEGQLTKLRMKLEMMAVHTALRAWAKTGIRLVAYRKDSGEKLIEVK